ncbi:MAG: DUF4386 family protein [Anaerolineales bacterium]|jgi:hypothetical protein
MKTTSAGSTDSHWKDLYKVGGATTIILELLIVLGGIAFVTWPYTPGSTPVREIYTTLQNDRLGGLMSLDFLLFLSNIIGVLLFLALYASLKQVNESYALIALVMGLLAAVFIVPARPMAELITLSDGYAAAATEAAKSQYLAAGEALLAQFDGTAYLANTFLGGASLLISSLLMLHGKIFSKATAYVGILTNLAVCLFFVPIVGTYFLFLCLPGYVIWYVQLGRTFFRLGRGAPLLLQND